MGGCEGPNIHHHIGVADQLHVHVTCGRLPGNVTWYTDGCGLHYTHDTVPLQLLL